VSRTSIANLFPFDPPPAAFHAGAHGAAASIKEAVTAIAPERLRSTKNASGARPATRPGQTSTIVMREARSKGRTMSNYVPADVAYRSRNRTGRESCSGNVDRQTAAPAIHRAALNEAVKLKTSGRALPEVSEVKHKVAFGLPWLRAVKPFAGYLDRNNT
jgi:hypothetical protein